MKALLRFLLRLLFRFRAYNEEALRTAGPVLLVPNHVSWFDWLLIGVCLEDDWKFVVSSQAAEMSWFHRKVMLNRRTFPVDMNSPYAIKRMAEYLQGNGRLVLFAEGRLSRTGRLMKLFDGTGFLLHKTRAKVITGYLRGAERLPLCPHPGWRRWFPRVSAHFSEVLTAPDTAGVSASESRAQTTTWLRDQMVEQQFRVEMEFGPRDVLGAIVSMAREHPRQVVMEDATTQALTYRRLLAGVAALSEPLGRKLSNDEERVGVLLPNLNAVPVLLMALWRLGKTPAVLNFSTGGATMRTCAQVAGLKSVVTSREFLKRAKVDVQPMAEAGVRLLYLEDLRREIGGVQRLGALLTAMFRPGSLTNSALNSDTTSPPFDGGKGAGATKSETLAERDGTRTSDRSNRTAVVLFTSGSEGMPKGVELTHTNLLANIRQMVAVTDISDTDRLFNCLPMFHSFGLTVGTLLPLVRGLYVFIFPSPLQYKVVPTVFYDRDCTIFLSTNTFLNGYARKAHAYDFRSMRYLFAAAEKLQESTAATWSHQFGVRVLEGYGATECGPCVSVNTPLEPQYGSVGRLLPGMEHRLEPVPGVEDGGRLLVRGPNVMKGYLNPEANAKFHALGGWYDTGDIVGVDARGFLHIRGRLKRFAKVSGEMVSLTAVEDALAGAFPQYGLRCQVAVVARPDEEKGEALIAVTNESKLKMEEIRAAIKAKGLSNLSVPREIRVVREIPKLGTGKVDHRQLAKLMEEGKIETANAPENGQEPISTTNEHE